MLISGSKPYRARYPGTIASGLIKKTNWSRLIDTDQGTMIKTTFDNKGKLIKMTLLLCQKWICRRSEKSDLFVRFKQMSETNCMFNKLSLKILCKVCNSIKGYSRPYPFVRRESVAGLRSQIYLSDLNKFKKMVSVFSFALLDSNNCDSKWLFTKLTGYQYIVLWKGACRPDDDPNTRQLAPVLGYQQLFQQQNLTLIKCRALSQIMRCQQILPQCSSLSKLWSGQNISIWWVRA